MADKTFSARQCYFYFWGEKGVGVGDAELGGGD